MQTNGRILVGSYFLFGSLLISLLWHDRWLPPPIGIAAVTLIVIGWVVSLYFFMKNLRLTIRQKIIGWSAALAFIAFSFAERFSSYSIFHDTWDWVFWDALGISVFFIPLGLAKLLFKDQSNLGNAAPYTIESEVPDHVAHIRDASIGSRDADLRVP